MNYTDLNIFAEKAEKELSAVFSDIHEISRHNTEKVLKAFADFHVSASHLNPSDGYGYGDRGRDTLDKIYAAVFGTPDAFVRHSIASGTHAIAIGLFGLLRPGDTLLSVTGEPYDTLHSVISGKNCGSLADFGIKYEAVELKNGKIDMKTIAERLKSNKSIKVVYAQRSRGYSSRRTLSVAELNDFADEVHKISDTGKSVYTVIDNCYGEFTEKEEPYKADLLIGSLIKNPGGGLADCGGYLAGSEEAVRLASYRLTFPDAGLEVGASLNQNKNLYRGFFFAPHIVGEALKTALFAAYMCSALGFETSPAWNEKRSDIIQALTLSSPDRLCAFCRGIQSGSPVDSFVTPEPWDMPGYEDKVIMAAGTFVNGASIELSADGPLRPPYTAYIQGGLTYESGRYGILCALKELLKL